MKAYFPTCDLLSEKPLAIALWLVAIASVAVATEPKELRVGHDEYLYMIRFSPDGKTLVTAAGDNVARVWDWSTRELLHTLEHEAAVYAAVFSPGEDGADLVATGDGEGIVSLWNATTGKLVAQRQEHADAVYCLNFAPDGRSLASIGGDGKKGDTLCRVWSVPTLEIAKILPGHDRPAYGVLFGRLANMASVILTSGGDKLIHVYTQPSDERLTLEGHTSDVYRCCLSPDGKQLASTSQDRTVRIWDVTNGNQLKTLFKGKDPTYDVAYSRNGKLLAAVADDGFVRFWNTETRELLLKTRADKEGLYSVVFTPHQTSVLTGGAGGRVYECAIPKLDGK